ncbi:MAG: glycine cleavage system protein H [Bryobacteraceae bacterium]
MYKRARFGTRLPVGRRYTLSHYWLREEEPGVWRIGFAKFATRMLGELVEFEFATPVGSAAEVGQSIGWVEGFKAVSDLYSVVTGEFLGSNPALAKDITLVDSDHYETGWLYRARGVPDPGAVDVSGYVAVLNATIDKMLGSRYSEGKSDV